MINLIRKPLDYVVNRTIVGMSYQGEIHEQLLIAQGRMLANQVRDRSITRLEEVEFRIFSQFEDDGIIQWLIAQLPGIPETFVEFGVEYYTQSNTRFLMMNNNWNGLIMDGSASNINLVRTSYYFWRHELVALAAFVTAENINGLLTNSPGADVGILHIDLDGNDYWIWEAIENRPWVVIVEYNSLFGRERPISVPYAADFTCSAAHPSMLYYGASLAALTHLANTKGYKFIGSNSGGNNAYFVRSDLLNERVREMPVSAGYRLSKFRQSWNGTPAVLGAERVAPIRGMPVVNVTTGATEPF